MKKKILIVGGSGFIGSKLSEKCLKKNFDITLLFSNKKKTVNSSFKKIICNISKKKELNKKLKNKNFDYVINLGGYVDHSKKIKTFKTHYNGCKNLIDHFKNKNLLKFVQIGSSVEYGMNKAPQLENKITNEKNLKSIYGLAKLKSTNYLINLNKFFFFPYTVIRFFLVYGPGQLENRLIPFVIKSCLADKKFKTSSGIQLRDFLYIDDAVDAIISVLNNKNSNGQIINICSSSPVKIKNKIKLINKKIKKGKPIFGKVKLRPDEPIKLYSNYNKARKILNWKPKVNLPEGIDKTIKYYAKGI